VTGSACATSIRSTSLSVVVAARYGWRAISAFRHGADIDQPGHDEAAAMTLEFALCLLTLFFLAGIGTPVAYSIIVSSFVYLAVNGQGVGIAGKVLMDGLYQSFILLAVPLFIVAANIMNAGTISDRLLQFCVAAVGRFRGGLGHVNIVASLIFSGMSGSAVADAAGIGKIIIGMMTKRALQPRLRGGDHRGLGDHRSDHPAIDPDGALRAGLQHVDRVSVSRRYRAGPVHGRGADDDEHADLALGATCTIEEPVPLRELPRQTANAFPALLMPAILLYGIYGGVTTPTEAAAVAAAYALPARRLFYRALSLRALYGILVDSARSSAAVGIVIGGALILNYVVASENIPDIMARRSSASTFRR
jgi:TRAP-type mannitol/chloroaromatic compound transport system permease large subunit